MKGMNLNYQGILEINIDSMKYLINNFTQTNTLTNWTFGTNTFTNGIVELTGTNPSITSSTFTVNTTDIICFEFTLSVPTPSTKTSGGGVYIGSKNGQTVYVHSFNPTTQTWTQSTTTTTNPYFIASYNKTNTLIIKNYILGSEVDLNDIPVGETTDNSFYPKAIQLTSGLTSTNIRSGYNGGNSSMIIHFSNPKIYNIKERGFYDGNEITTVNFGNNFIQANNLYEF